MKRALLLGIATLALAGIALPASAADLGAPVSKAPIAAPFYNWSGFYIGGNIGAKWGDFNGSETIAPFPAGPGGVLLFGSNNGVLGNNSNTSFVGGGQIGYNWQFSQWVFGLEGDFDATDVRRTVVCCATVLALPTTFIPGDSLALKNEWQASIRGRLGYAWDRFLIYATGGVAFADVQAAANFVPGVLLATNTQTVVGGTVGAGVEFGLWDSWSLGVEYRYTQYDHANFALGFLPVVGGTTPVTATSDLTTNEVTARLNYRFNWGAPVAARY